jgi:hypothetical protein
VDVGVAATIWAVRKVRNIVLFHNVFLKDPCSTVCKILYWMYNWACRHNNYCLVWRMKLSLALKIGRHRGGELQVKLKIIELVDQAVFFKRSKLYCWMK